ncbi:hypothetical protein BP6252_03498 [Coleophoma cylindrospora]|uniref:Uncharacterized protein n=1 Tax=Coleophoma cylindrospora TaxID=1849047 RepID=A0A3D8S7V8_9HELO|nr:hypothetical protein BP6252_03498 [Coleophoma cylindrospora]
MAQIQFPRAVSGMQTSELNFHAGRTPIDSYSQDIALQSLISGEQKGDSNFHSGKPMARAGNFHSGDLGDKSNLFAGTSGNESNFHAGKVKSRVGNFHAGDFDENVESNFHVGRTNFHAGSFHGENFHAGANCFYTGDLWSESNFHAGNSKGGSNFHAGQYNFHAGGATTDSNFHAGNFYIPKSLNTRDLSLDLNFHVGNLRDMLNFHAGNFHAGGSKDVDCNFHRGQNFHTGNYHAGTNFHAGNFHAGGSKDVDCNFHRGQNFHTGNYHAGTNFHAGNFHAGGSKDVDCNFHRGQNFHTGNYHAGTNFHTGNPFEINNTVDSAPLNKASSKSITATVSFYAATADGNPAYNYVEKPATSSTYSNVLTSSHQIPIEDIRGRHQDFNLDQHAVLALTGLREHGRDLFDSDEQVVQTFYPDVVDTLLTQVPGAQHVVIFDHTIRRQNGNRGPVLRAHIDQTPASALARVRRHLSCSGAEQLLSGRVRLVNYWRPINGSVETYPLAFADSQTVRDEDLVSVEHRYPEWTGATFGVKYREDQKWFYWGGMAADEGLLLQCFDSELGARLAHSAVLDPDLVSDKVRESIEVRALIFG